MWVFTLFLRLFMADESAEGRIDAGAVEDVRRRLDAMVSMSLRYVLLAASRLIVDPRGGRNEPPTVLLIKGSHCHYPRHVPQPQRRCARYNLGHLPRQVVSRGRRTRIEVQRREVDTCHPTLVKTLLMMT